MTDLNTNESNSLVPVPNGTEASVFDGLVKKFSALARKSAEDIVKLGETLLEAKQKLSEQRLKEYCIKVGLDYKSPTFRKLLKIGQEASRFEPYLDRLPVGWTNYKLAVLEKDKFDIVAHDQRFGRWMTAAEVDLILAGSSDQGGDGLSRDLTIDLTGSDEAKKLKVYEQCKQLSEVYGFQLRLSKPFQRLVTPPTSRQSRGTSRRSHSKSTGSSLRSLMGEDE